MTRAFEVRWTVILVIVGVVSVRGAFYWWDESGPLAAVGWFLAAIVVNVAVVRLMLRSIAKRP